MQGHVVRPGEQVGQRHQFHAQGLRLFGLDVRIVAQQFRLEARQPLGHQPADVAQAHDADRLAGDFSAHEGGLLPLAGAAGRVGGNQMARVGQHQGNDLLGHAVGVGAGGVHHVHALRPGVLDVDCVVAGSGANDHLERGRRVDDFRRDFLAPHDEGVQIGILARELENVALGNLHHRVAAMSLQDVLGHGIQRRRNQYLFHRFPFRRVKTGMECRHCIPPGGRAQALPRLPPSRRIAS